MEISVIIPTYEPRDYIYECLDSLEKQTLDKSKFEVILIINGQRNPYENQIKKYLKNKKIGVRVIYSEKKGVSNARNLGLESSKGENIIFIDDDDFVSNNYLETLLKNKESEDTIIQANVNDFYDNLEKKYDFLPRNYMSNSYEKNLIRFNFLGSLSVIWGKLIPKKIIEDIRFNLEFCNGEDTLFISEISKNIKLIKTINQNTVYYRRKRFDSLHFKKRNRVKKIVNLSKLIKIHFKILKERDSNKKFITYRIITLLLGFFK